MKIKATWGMEFDWRNDECYEAPMHLECEAPIMFHDGSYKCIGCGQEVEALDKDMKDWIDARVGTKTETGPCLQCGKNTMVIHYYKNHNTLEWETGHGECSNCGARFIV